MNTIPAGAPPACPPSASRLVAVFCVLFVAYQLPEGLGWRTLHSFPVLAGLMLMFLPVAWLCGRALGWRGLDAWFIDLRPGWLTLLGACFAVSVLAKMVALAAGAALGIYEIRFTEGLALQGWLLAALAVLPSTFFPSIAEDIVTRGFLLRALPALGRRPLFIVASALLFVLNHIYRLANGPVEWVMLFSFGLAYAAALYYSRSLWAAIGLHWGWNYAGQLGDKVASIDATGLGPMVSVAAHLVVLAGIVLFSTRLRQRGAAGAAQPT